jgi:hypothetical protein
MNSGKWFKAAYGCLIISLSLPWLMTQAQLRSGVSSIALTARLEGSVVLSQPRVHVLVNVSGQGQSAVTVPVRVRWNLDPRTTQSFRVVGYMEGRSAALRSDEEVVGAEAIEARVDGREFRPFWEKNSSLVLFNVNIDQSTRQGEVEKAVQLRIANERMRDLPDGLYAGWLRMEVQQQN